MARGVPAPTVITSSPEKGTAHITWFFAIGLNRSNPSQMRLFQGIKDRLNRELDGDPNFKNHLGKNPLHEAYEVHSFVPQAYELREFLDPLQAWSDEGDYVLPPRLAAQHEGRRPGIQAIPTTLRDIAGTKGSRVFWMAVELVRRLRTSDLATIRATFERVAAELKSPATAKQLDGMASRCAVWMAKQAWATGRPVNGMARPGIDHGAMTREAEQAGKLETWMRTAREVKLPLAAARTNELRKGKTRANIVEAVQRLHERGEVVNQSSLAVESGCSLKTIKRAWNDDSIFKQEGVTRSYPYCAASRPEGGRVALTLSYISVQSKIEAKRREEDAQRIQAYDELTARMMKRGARPEVVPPRGPDASQDVVDAHRRALAARDLARGKQDERERKAELKARKAERQEIFIEWARSNDEEAFKAFYQSEVRKWEARELRIDPSEKEQLRTHHLRMRSYLKRVRADWDQARARHAVIPNDPVQSPFPPLPSFLRRFGNRVSGAPQK
jgi:hypothetical protein